MAEVTGLTAERMLEIEAACIVNGGVVLGDLMLTRQDGSTFNAGRVKGDKGDPGAPGQNAAPGSVAPAPNTTPIRTSDSRVKTARPTEEDDAATLRYVEDRVDGPLIGPAIDLNNLTKPGYYYQNLNADAAGGLNYPVAYAGVLEVTSGLHHGVGMVWQTYTPYREYGQVFYKRNYYSTLTPAWGPWVRFSSDTDSTMRHKQFIGGSAISTTSTSATRFEGGPAGSFVAPPSGLVTVSLTIYMYSTSTTVDCLAGFQIFTGGTVGSGSLMANHHGMLRTRFGSWQRYGGMMQANALTPDTTYNIFATYASGAAGTAVYVSSGYLIVMPSP